MARLRRVVLERLIRYYRYLSDTTAKRPVETVTSAELARILDVDPSQVRKDFAAAGLTGMSRVGYDVCEACRTIRTTLGFDEPYEAVVVGTGHLGAAILNYSGFDRFGLRIVAAFDSDPALIGTSEGGLVVRSVHDLRSFIQEHRIPLAILTTPGSAAPGLADLVTVAGVRAIWNFTPVRLTDGEGVLVRNEHISVGLAQIAFHLKNSPDRVPATAPADPDCCGSDPGRNGPADAG